MKTYTKILSIFFILTINLFFCQLQLTFTAKNAESFPVHLKKLYQDHLAVEQYGYIFYVTLVNTSNDTVSLPVDTTSYALPYTSDINQFKKDKYTVSDPYETNSLSAYTYVYQNNLFLSSSMYDDPQYENEQLAQKQKFENLFQNKIRNWKKKKELKNDLHAIYNWYLLNNIISIPPKCSLEYEMYFNPLLKTTKEYGYKNFITILIKNCRTRLYYGSLHRTSYTNF